MKRLRQQVLFVKIKGTETLTALIFLDRDPDLIIFSKDYFAIVWN